MSKLFYRIKNGTGLEEKTDFLFNGSSFLKENEERIKKIIGLTDIGHMSFLPTSQATLALQSKYANLYPDLKDELKKDSSEGSRFFKKNSKTNKAWLKLLKEINVLEKIESLSANYYFFVNFPFEGSPRTVTPKMLGHHYIESKKELDMDELEQVESHEYFQVKADHEKSKAVQ